MTGPALTRCGKCGFGYAHAEHTEEECKLWQAESADPCGECGHGKHFHSDDGTMCVQAIAGGANFFPSFCRCKGYTAKDG